MSAIKKQFSLKQISLDISAYERALKVEMEEEIKAAAINWLQTALSIVPVWSRASHATFKPLADAVGFVIPTQPLIAKKDRTALGRGASSGGLEITKDTFKFIYETDLKYLAANEFMHVEFPDHGIFSPQGLKTETPFNFTARGAEQFREQATKIRLPNPFRFLQAKSI